MCIWFCPFLNILHFTVTVSSFNFHKISPGAFIVPVSCVCPVIVSCSSHTCNNVSVVWSSWYLPSGSNGLWVSLIFITFVWFILNPWGTPWLYHRYWYFCQFKLLSQLLPLTLTTCWTSSSQTLCATITSKKMGRVRTNLWLSSLTHAVLPELFIFCLLLFQVLTHQSPL